jgi:hypothetical protein
MTDRFDNEESTGFVSDVPEAAVSFLPRGYAMKVKAIFQQVHDHLNREPELQKEFDAAVKVLALYGKDPLKPGEVFKLSEPRFVGEMPKIEVLEVEKSSELKIGWTCEERRGWEVKLITPEFDQQIIQCADDEEKSELIHSCANMTEAKEGTKVLAMGITGWVRGVVREKSELVSFWHVDAGGSVFPLELASDERCCWVTTSQINKRIFEMELKR